MAFMLKQRIALSASKEYILVNFISIRGYHDKPVRQLSGYKIKINKVLMYDHKEPPKVYHLRINGKIIP